MGAGLLAKAAWQSTQLDGVHIHCCGNGHLGFRPDGGSLLKSRNAGPDKSKQNALARPLGTSLRLGVPVIRQRGLTGRLRSKADQERLASHRGYRLLRQPTKLSRYLCRDGGASADDSLLTHSHRRQARAHICFALPPGYVL